LELVDPFPTSTAVKGCDWQGRLAAALPSFDVVLHVVCLLEGAGQICFLPGVSFLRTGSSQSVKR
jgi:hypothetical protein